MPAPPPPPRAQTIKQAKAAYKARGQPTVSDAERRRLQREIELERRALRAKESEKKKSEAAKKRVEKEKEGRETVRLATQVICDKSGHKSSQMHLGAFLMKPGLVTEAKGKSPEASVRDIGEEDFGDSDVDDATLLDALDGTCDIRQAPIGLSAIDLSRQDTLTSASQSPVSEKPIAIPSNSGADDFASFFDDFGTSTQIARELNADEQVQGAPSPQAKVTETQKSSNEYDDFDLTVEDLEDFDPPNQHASEDRKLMPPPPLPLTRTTPILPLGGGFTIRELEQYVDDDLQLTQFDPT